MYAVIAKPLYGLIVMFNWMEEYKETFKKLKNTLTFASILKSLDWNLTFHVHIDASTFAIGCILTQPGEKNMDFPISYASKQLNTKKRNYTTIERQGLGMIYAVKKFWHSLLVVTKKGLTHQRTDHLSRMTHGETLAEVDDDQSGHLSI